MLLLLLVIATALGAPAGYQLAITQRNAVGVGAASASIGDHIYVVGGSGDEARSMTDPQLQFLYRDTRRFSVSQSSWRSVSALPQQRAYHSLDSFQDQLLLFGGLSAGNVFSDELLQYNPVFDSWTTRVLTNKPPARAGHSSAVVGGSLYVFGGRTATGLASDTWALQLSGGSAAWQQVTGAGPSARVFASGSASNGRFCVYGGTSDGTSALNDLLCLGNGVWETVASLSGSAPRTFGHQAEQSGTQLIVHGGASHFAVSLFDFTTLAWSTPIGSLQVPLRQHASSLNGAVLFSFGGIDQSAAGGRFNTRVISTGPVGTWAQGDRGCEPAYTGSGCLTPVCQNSCHGLGRCVAPDLCECLQGFSGSGCTEYNCEVCGFNLKELNQPIFYPMARNKALVCLASLRAKLREVQARLAGTRNLSGISRDAWEFEQQEAKALLAATTQVLALLRS